MKGLVEMDEFTNKTVLITGATGLIASHIVDKLMEQGDVRVIALSRSEKKISAGFKEYLNNPYFSYIAQDVLKPISIDEHVDYIFHAAGPMEGKIIRERPMDVINPNINGLINCLEVLRKQKEETGTSGRIVLFSSVTVYGNISNEDITVSEEFTRVTENLDSISAPYSQSKRMIEVIALAYARQYGIDVVIPRFSTVYGPTRFIPDTAFFEFIKKSISGEDITLNSSNLPRRDNIYIDDAVEAVLTVAAKGENMQAYNISSNGDLRNYASIDEIAESIARIANMLYGSQVVVKYKSDAIGKRTPGLKMNNERVASFGWNIHNSLEDGVTKTIRALEKRYRNSELKDRSQ